MKKVVVIVAMSIMMLGLFCQRMQGFNNREDRFRTPDRDRQRRHRPLIVPPAAQRRRLNRVRPPMTPAAQDPLMAHFIQSFAQDSVVFAREGFAPGWVTYIVERFGPPEGGNPAISRMVIHMKGATLDGLNLDPRWVERGGFLQVQEDPRQPEDICISLIIDYKQRGGHSYSTREIFNSPDLLNLLRKIQALYREKMKPYKRPPKTKKYYDIIIKTREEETEDPEEAQRITPKEEKELIKKMEK